MIKKNKSEKKSSKEGIFKSAIVGTTIAAVLGSFLWLDTKKMEQFYALPNSDIYKKEILEFTKDEDAINAPTYPIQPHTYRLHTNIPNLEFAGFKQHDENGFRIGEETISREKPEDQIRIFALGGSTTHSIHYVTDPQKSWTMQLGSMLRETYNLNPEQLRTINAGIDGGTTKELFIQYAERDAQFHPDVLILHTGINDMYALTIPGNGPSEGERYINGEGYLSDYTHYRKEKREMGLLEQSLLKSGLGTWVVYNSLKSRGVFFHPTQEILDLYSGPEALERVENLFENSENLGFTQNIRNLAAIAKYNGTRVILAPVPQPPLEELRRRGQPEAFIYSMEKHREIMREIADRDENISYLEIPSDYSISEIVDNTTGQPVPLWRYMEDSVHVFGEEGHKIKARAMHDHLVDNDLLNLRDKKN